MAGKEITALISGSYPDGNLEPVRKASTQSKKTSKQQEQQIPADLFSNHQRLVLNK